MDCKDKLSVSTYMPFNISSILRYLAERVKLKLIPYVLIVTDEKWTPSGHWGLFLIHLDVKGNLEVVCCDSLNHEDLSNVDNPVSFIRVLHKEAIEPINRTYNKIKTPLE